MELLEPEELLQFFHCHKTELSCMENPHTFLSQLRDYNLVPEDRYKMVSRMKSKAKMKKALYDILEWFERERSQHILLFWRCVFKPTIMNLYPTLQLLHKSLMDGSFQFDAPVPEMVEKEGTNEKKRMELSEDEEEPVNSVKKKRKQRSSLCDDEEQQPGPSPQLTLGQRKKSKKICFSSPLKKGETTDFWNWPIYKFQLPVSCGCQEGTLSRDRLAKGERCILFQNEWFTPSEFAGMHGSKYWKRSIRCMGTPLGKLIQEGHLKSACYKGGHNKSKRPMFPPDQAITDEEETEDQDQQQPGIHHGSSQSVFKVTCGDLAGTLHKKRFGSGTCGKSIRTEMSWLSPVEFVKEAACHTDASWKKHIKWKGKPLSFLIEANILNIHSLLCTCIVCRPTHQDLENQKNDDECLVCKTEEEKLLVCDKCPRSFHQTCHLPHVDDATLGDKRPWICTFCVFQTAQEWRYSDKLESNAVLSHQISQHMLECQYLLLTLCIADEEKTFALNPSLYLEDYSTVIETPMWLGSIASKLQKNEYQTVGEFVSDVQLIFTNCTSYNRANPEFLAMGDQLKELFNGEFQKVFNICEQSAD